MWIVEVGEELAGLRRFLEWLKSGKMSIRENGRDVTQREIEKLEPDIKYLEAVLAWEVRSKNHKVLEKLLALARWVFLAPAAIAGAWVAYFIFNLVSRFFMVSGGANLDSFLCRMYLEGMSGIVMGGTFVFVGTMTAPAYRKQTNFILAVVGLLAVGMMMWAAVMEPNYWALWGGVFTAIGIGVVA